MCKGQFAALAASALLILSPGLVRAQITTYTFQSDFNAATTAVSTQTFEGVAANLAVGNGTSTTVSNPLNNSTNNGILTGLEIDGTNNLSGDLTVGGPGFSGFNFANYSVSGSDVGEGLDFDFGPGVTAASLDILTISGLNADVTVYDSSDTVIGLYDLDVTPDAQLGQFWGVTDTDDIIGSLVLSPGRGTHFVGVDQVQFGSALVTPEPSSLWLLGTGMLGALAAFRRRIIR